MSKILKITGGILACLLVAGAASSVLTITCGDKINDWYDELVGNDEEKVDYENQLNKLVSTNKISDLTLTAENIKAYAFCNTDDGLISITLDGKLSLPNCTVVENFAFEEQNGINELYLPKIKEIGRYAFSYVKSNELNLPEIINIDEYAFLGCEIKKIDLGSNIEKIGIGAFSEVKSLDTIIIRNAKTIIDFGDRILADSDFVENDEAYIYVPESLLYDYKTNTKVLEMVNNDISRIRSLTLLDDIEPSVEISISSEASASASASA